MFLFLESVDISWNIILIDISDLDCMTVQVTETPSCADKNWPINWSKTWLMMLISKSDAWNLYIHLHALPSHIISQIYFKTRSPYCNKFMNTRIIFLYWALMLGTVTNSYTPVRKYCSNNLYTREPTMNMCLVYFNKFTPCQGPEHSWAIKPNIL